MPPTVSQFRVKGAVRDERERAVRLLLLLAAFLAVYIVVIAAPAEQILDRLAPTLPGVLTTMVGVGISVLVTTFSFVFVALSLVSVQFSPRVVRHFWHGDRFRLIFLWSFIGVFGFCWAALFIDSPNMKLLALILSAYQVFVLFPIFLGYLADNINAASITQNIANRTVAEIAKDYAEVLPASGNDDGAVRIRSKRSGFLERIDTNKLISVFSEIRKAHPDATMRLVNYLGSFIEVGSSLVVIDGTIGVDGRTERSVNKCFRIHKFRSIDQDIEYGIRQLVDIGVKAISPAVNDPTTCVNCIHYLGVIIRELAVCDERTLQSKELEKHGIFIKEPSFEQYLDDAFDQIYQFGRHDHVIVRTIIGVLTEVMKSTRDAGRAAIVLREVEDMELAYLYEDGLGSPLPLRENRNYVRKALLRFYRSASEKFSEFGESALAERTSRLSVRVEDSFGK